MSIDLWTAVKMMLIVVGILGVLAGFTLGWQVGSYIIGIFV